MLLQVGLCGYYVVACVEFVGKAQRSILSDVELAGNGSDGGVERVDLAVEQVDFLVGRDELLPQAVDFLNLRINLNAQGFDGLGEFLVVDGGIAEPRLELLKLLLTLLDFFLRLAMSERICAFCPAFSTGWAAATVIIFSSCLICCRLVETSFTRASSSSRSWSAVASSCLEISSSDCCSGCLSPPQDASIAATAIEMMIGLVVMMNVNRIVRIV